ncbi:MAG TPA: corrinoid protein [Acidobacteriota bacterium]|nr:corrinoid protein [Acidobacteriota bacterium]
MESDELLSHLASSVVEGDEEAVLEWTEKSLAAGLSPLKILEEGLTRGIEVVGDEFGSGRFFLPDLVLGAGAMERGIQRLEPLLAAADRKNAGKVVIGTVEGDLHEIGKNIVKMMLKTAGFDIVDLGVDVPTARFIDEVRDFEPHILGISALLTTTVSRQREIIEQLDTEGLRDQVKVIVGGAPINQDWADQIGADAYAEDATVAVKIAQSLVNAADGGTSGEPASGISTPPEIDETPTLGT